MAEDNKVQALAAAQAPAKVAETVANTVQKVAEETVKTAKKTRAATARRAKRDGTATARRAKPARATATRKTAARKTATARKTAGRKAAATNQRIETLTNGNYFNGFDAVPGFAPFQNLFGDVNDRSQQAVRRSQQVAEELADLTRANIEAVVEAGRVAAEGARSIGQDVVARGREGVEQAADAIRTLAEAKSPTEYLQIQGDIARTSFDRMVAESSRLTEAMVKLAGEAFQPLSNRATANAGRFNSFVA